MFSTIHGRTEEMRTKPILLPGAQVLLLSPTKEATPAKVNLSSVDPLHQVLIFKLVIHATFSQVFFPSRAHQ